MISLFRRRPRLPADRRPAIEPDERIVAWAEAEEGGVVVATTRGLFLPGRDRLGWHEIHKVTWSGRMLAVVAAAVVEKHHGYDVVEDLPPTSYSLNDPGDVPHQVRARVTRSVAYSVHHRLAGGGVRVVARRVPGVDGLTWAVRYDPGTEPAAELVADLVETARAQI